VCPNRKAHWRHLANTIEPSVCGGDAVLCQITLTTCYYKANECRPVGVRESLYGRQHEYQPRMLVVRQRCQGRRRWHLDNAAETIVAGRRPRPAAEVVPLAADGGRRTALRRRHTVIGDATWSIQDSIALFLKTYQAAWRDGAMRKAFGLAISRSRVQILLQATLRNNLGQVVYTYVPLSPNSITWYRPKGGDALRLGR